MARKAGVQAQSQVHLPKRLRIPAIWGPRGRMNHRTMKRALRAECDFPWRRALRRGCSYRCRDRAGASRSGACATRWPRAHMAWRCRLGAATLRLPVAPRAPIAAQMAERDAAIALSRRCARSSAASARFSDQERQRRVRIAIGPPCVCGSGRRGLVGALPRARVGVGGAAVTKTRAAQDGARPTRSRDGPYPIRCARLVRSADAGGESATRRW